MLQYHPFRMALVIGPIGISRKTQTIRSDPCRVKADNLALSKSEGIRYNTTLANRQALVGNHKLLHSQKEQDTLKK